MPRGTVMCWKWAKRRMRPKFYDFPHLQTLTLARSVISQMSLTYQNKVQSICCTAISFMSRLTPGASRTEPYLIRVLSGEISKIATGSYTWENDNVVNVAKLLSLMLTPDSRGNSPISDGSVVSSFPERYKERSDCKNRISGDSSVMPMSWRNKNSKEGSCQNVSGKTAILFSEIKHRKKLSITFTTKWLRLFSISCFITGCLAPLFLFLGYIPIFCTFARFIGFSCFALQGIFMGFYQLARLYYCFANTQIHSNRGYKKQVFIVMSLLR